MKSVLGNIEAGAVLTALKNDLPEHDRAVVVRAVLGGESATSVKEGGQMEGACAGI